MPQRLGSSSGQSGYDLSFKIFNIGDSGVGKSRLLVSFIYRAVSDLAPTIGISMQEQLKEAQCKIEEQAAAHSRVMAEQKDKLQHLSLVEEYLRQTDPTFLDFMAVRSASGTASTPPASSPPAP